MQAGRCVFGGLPFFVGSGESANQRVREGGLDDVCGEHRGKVENILSNPHLEAYSRDLLSGMASRIRGSIQAANEAGIEDPTFVTLGEEVRAWKLLLDGRFDRVRDEVDELMSEWFSE